MDAQNGKANGLAHRPTWLNRVESWFRPSPLTEARRQLEIAKTQAELTQINKSKKLLEDSLTGDFWLTPYLQLLDRTGQEFGDRPFYLSNFSDRQYGRAFPFFINEGQLAFLRGQARLLCGKNSYAIGLLTGLTSFVVGAGFTYRATSDDSPNLAKDVQKEIDRFLELNQWSVLEQELFWRSREDGEFFLRYFESEDGVLIVRTVEPEQCMQEPGSDYREFSFGVHSDPEDVQTVYGYWIRYLDTAGSGTNNIGEEVPAEEMLHFKVNVKRSIKRGLSDFSFDVYDALRAASKIRLNAGEGAAIQAATAVIRQWETATLSSVSTFTQGQVDLTTTNPLSGKSTDYHQVEPGAILDIPRGMSYVPPPGSAPGVAEGHEIILHAQLRAAGTRWNAPEWLATASGADMAAYTASLTAENPFVKTAERYQDDYEKAFTKVIRRAVQVAIDAGRLPPDTLKIVEIQCEGPEIAAKDELQEAQANTARVQGGWKSRQTVAQEEGLDWDLEMANIEEYQERFGGMVPGAEGNDTNDTNDTNDGTAGEGGGQPWQPKAQADEDKEAEKAKEEQLAGPWQPKAGADEDKEAEKKKASESTELVLRATARLLEARGKPTSSQAPAPAQPVSSPDVKELCEAVKTLARREQATIQLPKEVAIPAPVVNIAPAEAPVVHVTPPAITVLPPEVHVAAPEVIAPPQDRPESLKRDKKGRVCEIAYSSGAVYTVQRDAQGRILKLVPKGK